MTTVTNDGLLAIADRVGVQTFPIVLAIGPQQDSVEAWNEAQRAALTELSHAGVIDQYGEVDGELADALRILAQPEREIVARVYRENSIRRVCIARRGLDHALAIRDGDTLDISLMWCDGSNDALTRPLLDVLDAASSVASVPTLSYPTAALRQALDEGSDAHGFALALATVGVDPDTAKAYGECFAACTGHAEIAAYVHEDGATTQTPGAVVVYETDKGRLVAAPGTSPHGELWSTFSPGTDHRLAHAIGALIESLPGGRWMP